jgi:hypothetical protein
MTFIGAIQLQEIARMSSGAGEIPPNFNLSAEGFAMSPMPTYPGIHIEEAPAGVRAVAGVPMLITAFIGRAARGLIGKPARTQSLADFDRQFSGLWANSTMSHSVRHFFQNVGNDAIIVR